MTTLSFLPWLNSDLATAFSRRETVLLSSSYTHRISRNPFPFFAESTHLGAGNVQLNLAAVSAHQSAELLANTLQSTETVVLGKGDEEVLQDVGLIGTGKLLEFGDDLLLVGVGEGRSAEDSGQLRVGLQGLAEGSDGLGGRVEGGGLGGGSVL